MERTVFNANYVLRMTCIEGEVCKGTIFLQTVLNL